MKFATKALHAGVKPDPETGAIMTPIYQTSTYVQRSPGDHQGYEYARTSNPTRSQLQDCLAALENAGFGIAFGSGVAAIDAVLKLLKSGDEVLSTNDLYGGTYRLFTKIFEPLGITFRFADLTDTGNIEKNISPATKLLWLETPTNPLMRIIDIAESARIAKKHGLMVAVDNTFASPYLQNPLDLGADIVMHSATKYIGGHSDLVMGFLMTNDNALAERLYFIQKSSGAVPGPMDCFLALRGVKTLHLRMEQHCKNGRKLAEFLATHAKVDKVFWPGFPNHPGHEIAKRQMRDFGGMISFTLKNDSKENAVKVLSAVKVIALAESLGGVESLISHPASMTHASIPAEERIKTGITDGLMRISVGVEDADDIIADLNQALDKV